MGYTADTYYGDDSGVRGFPSVDVLKCGECGRKFSIFDDEDMGEWANGHDCEAV